jgi:hypothetical protein
LAARAPERANLIGILDWRVSELSRLGVEIRTNVFADLSDVLAEDPDAVLITTGGLPNLDDIEGAAHCHSTWDLLSGSVRPAPRVLIHDGTGRAPAPSCALFARKAGSAVTFATSDGLVGQEMPYQDNTGYRQRFALEDIPVLADLDLTRVTRRDSGLVAQFTHCFSGRITEIETDQIVVERGTLPLADLYYEVKHAETYTGTLHRLGDAVSSRDIHAAIREAHVTALQV